jgi:hypothetical protein
MLDREQILAALSALSEQLRARGAVGELCLLGGTAMVLAFKARVSTKDVDAVFEPAAIVREAAVAVQRELDLPDGWLNDAAKGFVSGQHDVVTTDLPQFPGLRVMAPTAEYMLAMKCMASRIGVSTADPSDVADIRFLIRHLGLRRAEEAIDVVTRYYPASRVPPRAAYLLEEIFGEDGP